MKRVAVVSGWYGGTWGIRLSKKDRDRLFDPSWQEVKLYLDSTECVVVSISPSFWRESPEIRSREIGGWLKRKKLLPWPKGQPPKLLLKHRRENEFDLLTYQTGNRDY